MDELEITPADVKARMDRGEKLFLVDVREPWEHQLCRIEGAKPVPLGSLAANLQTLPDVDEVICYCHHGMELDAAAWLCFQGIEKAKSMSGGIERWSVEIDPKVPRYWDNVRIGGCNPPGVHPGKKETAWPKLKLNFCKNRRELLVARQEVSCWNWERNLSPAIWIKSD